MKQMAALVMDGEEKVCIVSKNDENCENSTSIEEGFPVKKEDAEICKESVKEENVELSSGKEINDSAIKTMTSNDMTMTIEEKEKGESFKNNACEQNKCKVAQGTIHTNGADKKSETVVNIEKNCVIETSAEIEKELIGICLTPAEENEIKRLILSAKENNYGKVLFISSIKQEDSEGKGCEGSTEAESDLDDGTSNSSKHHPAAPMFDVRGPFFINPKKVSFKYYEAQLISKTESCTQVVRNLCTQCNWTTPEFQIITLSKGKGHWSSLKINNHIFGTHKKTKNGAEAKHLVSARFLKFLGFMFSFDTCKNVNLVKTSSLVPWSEVYSNHNSISLQREEDKLGGFKTYSNCPRETKTDVNSSYYRQKRSSSNESRNSKISRTSNCTRRVDSVERMRISDEGAKSLKIRRNSTPESSRRRNSSAELSRQRNYSPESSRRRNSSTESSRQTNYSHESSRRRNSNRESPYREHNFRKDHEYRGSRSEHQKIPNTHMKDHGYQSSSSRSRHH